MRPSDLLKLTPQGLYCPMADVHIDPVQPVARALITHGHADHARAGHGAVLATRETLGIMAVRYGEGFTQSRQVANPGEPVNVNGVSFTFHPAGHVLGSAQIAVDAGGLRIVASGDYKRAPDLTCAAFEPIACDVFITEATFGLPQQLAQWLDVLDETGRWALLKLITFRPAALKVVINREAKVNPYATAVALMWLSTVGKLFPT
jgi:putative mRNA 3-end processing factor